MLTETSLYEGFEAAEKIRRVIELNDFSGHIRLTVSIGIEEYHGEKVIELVEKAKKNCMLQKIAEEIKLSCNKLRAEKQGLSDGKTHWEPRRNM